MEHDRGMTTNAWTFAPYLHVTGAAAAIDWYVRVLDAVERERHEMDGRIVHAELDLHGNLLCLADLDTGAARPQHYNEVPISLYAIVPDVDAVFQRALAAGASVDRDVADQPYGYRNGGFVDPFGHVWYLSTPIAQAAAT
jgi:PhnB protein